MPLSLWRNPSVAGANLVTALQSSAVFAMFYSTTLCQRQVLGYSALRTGLACIPARPVHPDLHQPRPGACAADRSPVRHGGRSPGIDSRPGVARPGLPVSGNVLASLLVPEMITGFGAG